MDDGNDGNVELSLGLSVGGNTNKSPPPLEAPDPSSGDLGGVSQPDWRREYQARRRKEARIKHEKKLLRRGIVRAKSSPILSESRNVREHHTSPATKTFPTMPPVPISYPTMPLVPHAGGYAIPCMVPFWATVPVLQPQSPQVSFGRRNHKESVGEVLCTSGKEVGKTSSDVSEYHKQGGSNGSSNTKTANSSIIFAEKHTEIPRGHSDHNISYHQLASPSNTENKMPDVVAPSNATSEPVNKPDIVAPQPDMHSESEMPRVATVGDDGKVITGFLSRFTSEEEVTIMCKCHGTAFTPAEFVKHAGGSEIEQPMKHIRIVPRAA